MKEQKRRLGFILILSFIAIGNFLVTRTPEQPQPSPQPAVMGESEDRDTPLASNVLQQLEVKGRAPKTDYARSQFGSGWDSAGGCNVRNLILARDMTDVVTRSETDCRVVSGTLNDPYTGKAIAFVSGANTSTDVQIDHVVALSDAWQKGAQQIGEIERQRFSNDPLNLLAVEGAANQQKGDGDAATWLPPNRVYRCMYVARQIAVKKRYTLWVTPAEKDAMSRVLQTCPEQQLPRTGTIL